MKSKYAYGLLDNARGFVESAVDYARQDRQEQWKFAILHLTTALELLLKATLAKEDPQLLVARRVQVTEHQLDVGDFQSVNIHECIERLNGIWHVSLNKRTQTVVKTLCNLRNRVVHYVNPSNANELKAAVGAGLNLFVEINNTEFQNEDPYNAKTMSQLIVELHKYDVFVKERIGCLSELLKSASRPRTHHMDECYYCLQNAAIIDRDDIRCLFCGHSNSIQNIAELLSDDLSIEKCPECARQSVAQHQRKDGEPTYECFCCGTFRGPELKWRDNGTDIPRLHPAVR